MKILQVLHGLSYGGAEKLACDLSLSLKSKYQMRIACLDGKGPLEGVLASYNIPVFCMNRRPGLDFSTAKNLARFYEEEQIDVVHAHQYSPFFYSVLGKVISRRKPVLIFTEHGRHQPDKTSWKRVIFNRLMLKQVNYVTGVSQFSKNSLVKFEWIPEKKVQVIYNGVTPVSYSCDTNNKRKEFGLNQNILIVGCIARFHSIKGQEILTKAFAEVVKSYSDVQLIYVGTGPCLDANKRLAEELGISSKILFMGDRADARDFLSIMDIFILPSFSEACSLALLDAMMAGKAIVATDAGGNSEMICDERVGLLVTVGDPHAMANAILDLLKDSEKRRKIGELAALRAAEKFEFSKMVEAYEKLYSRTASN